MNLENKFWNGEQFWKHGQFFKAWTFFWILRTNFEKKNKFGSANDFIKNEKKLNAENKFWNRKQIWKIPNKFGSTNIFWKCEQKILNLVHYMNFESFELFWVTRANVEFWGQFFLKSEHFMETETKFEYFYTKQEKRKWNNKRKKKNK